MNRTLQSIVRAQRGVTLTELMIALVLGALVVLAATAMVVSSRSTYRTQDESTRLAESARFGLELGNRLVRLAGYTNFGDDVAVPASYTIDPAWTVDSYAFNGPNLVGANDSVPGGGSGINGSDSLTIRFFGSSAQGSTLPDGNVLDCAGSPVPQAPSSATTAITNVARSYNVLFVEADPDGEPALKCQRQTYDPVTGVASGVASDKQTLIRGVEDFQVLYGELIAQSRAERRPRPERSREHRLPDRHRWTERGGELEQRPQRPHRDADAERRSGPGPTPSRSPRPTGCSGATIRRPRTPGPTFSLATASAADRTRVRRIVETTVFVRNRTTDWSSININ